MTDQSKQTDEDHPVDSDEKKFQAATQYAFEANRTMTEFGLMTLKAAILLNGGAAIALLAFLGNLVVGTTSNDSATPFGLALVSFAIGSIAAAVGAGFQYLKESFMFNMLLQLYSEQSDQERGVPLSRVFSNKSGRYELWAIYAVSASFLLFAIGVWQSYRAIF